MMTFEHNGNTYELTFPASTDFNIHLERSGSGRLTIQRRTSGSGWATIASDMRNKLVIDTDEYNELPREYRVVSESKPTLCVITFADGTVEDVEIPSVPDTPDTPSDVPSGYEVFGASDGEFSASDGDIYVKLSNE